MKSLCMALALVLVCMTSHAQMSEQEMRKLYSELHWMQPGSRGLIANKAEFKTTDQFTFLNAADTDKFLKLNGNPPTGGNAYTIAPVKGEWFGILQFAEEGYVKDDEKIDAPALLEQLKANNVSGNEVKRKEGYPSRHLRPIRPRLKRSLRPAFLEGSQMRNTGLGTRYLAWSHKHLLLRSSRPMTESAKTMR